MKPFDLVTFHITVFVKKFYDQLLPFDAFFKLNGYIPHIYIYIYINAYPWNLLIYTYFKCIRFI
jgi:hypothetical protein